MNLYILSNEHLVLEHWKMALELFHPVAIASIEEISAENTGIIFILDSTLSEILAETIFDYPLVQFMVLSIIPDFLQAQTVLQKGAKGYGNAMMHESHLQSAFQTLSEGKVWLYPDFVTQLIGQVREQSVHEEIALHRLDILSIREREVALLLNQGKSHLEISNELAITVRTIKAHCSAIYEKLQVKDRLALSLFLHS